MSYALIPTPTHFFTETESMGKIRNAVNFAIRTVESSSFSEPMPSLILGKPGTGKTAALLKIASEDQRMIYVQASEGDRKTKGLMKTILQTMSVWHDRRFSYDLVELVVDQINNRPNWSNAVEARDIILVDEYQSYDLGAIRELMKVCEHSFVPLILAGNQERLKATQVEKTALDQIQSRIGAKVSVQDHPTPKDCEKIGVTYNVEGKDAYNWLRNIGRSYSLRELTRVLDFCHDMTGGKGGIRLHHLQEANSLFQLAV